MKNSKLFLIFALFMVLLCCFSAVSASEDVSDDTVAVSDDFAVDEVIGEVDSNDESLSIPDEEILASDDSNNESLEINDVEEVDDVDNSSTALAAEENDVEEVDDVDNSSTALAAEENDDGLSGQSLTEEVSDEILKSSTFSKSNTIYELVNENYYFESALNSGLLIGTTGTAAVNNIIIRPKNNNKVRITLTDSNLQGIWIAMGNNITIENIIFTGQSNKINQGFFIIALNANVTIKNCIFENYNNLAENRELIIVGKMNNIAPIGATFEGCQFINCSAKSTFFKVDNVNLVTIKDCTFDNVSSINAYPFYFENVNVDWENNNIINSNSKTIFNIGGTNNNIFEVNFNVLTESLTLGEAGSIVGELVDDNGNRIKSDKLKLSIDGISETPTFDPNTGLYTSSKFTPTGNEVSVGAECSNIDPFNFETVYIPVKSTTDLVINCSDSGVYGTEFKVNATLNSTITGENITFTVFNSTNDLVKSVNTTITNGFASYSFADLPAGDYTVVANYTGGTSFAPAVSDNKTFTITQADSSVEIEVLNDIIHVGDIINVKAIVPAGATGNVTFRLENNNTVDVGEVATFNGLPNGTYIIYAKYNGDNNYKASEESTTTINVVKYNLNLSIAADNITYGEVLVVKVSTNSNFTGGIFVYIGELKQGAQITCGEGNATFANLTAAEYFITANFTEDDEFYADSANITATVKGVEVPADKAISTNVPANTKSPTFSIKLEKDATGNFTVSIDNGKIVKTAELKDGAASITVADLPAGNHNISISYSGDGKYAPITQNTTLTIKEPVKPTPKVTKKATKIVAKKKTFKAKVKVKKYTITLKSGKTLLKKVKVTLKVKGKTYKATTNNKGKATFKIKNLKKKGTYKAVIKFKGNKNYKATSKKVKIKVKK